MAFTQAPGADLYWKRDGRDDAPGLILLNSIGTDMDLWDALLPVLRVHYALLRIDTRGHGASIAEPGALSLVRLAADVLAVADAAGFDRFSLAGVSLGGMIGMELALRAPQRLEKLALVCTSATMDTSAWSERVTKVREYGMTSIADLAMSRFLSSEAEPAIYQSVRRQLLAMNPEGYASCAAAIRDMDLVDRIAAITSPTLVVTGSKDTSTPYQGHGEHLIARIPRSEHIELPVTHLAPLEGHGPLGGALFAFLEK